MSWFPKRGLKKLRAAAIDAANIISQCENHFGVINKQKQFATIQALRRKIEGRKASIGAERVILILNHEVPQIRDVCDLTNPRPGERGDLLPKQAVEAMISNINSQIDGIDRNRDRNTVFWRWAVGIVITIILGAFTIFKGCSG